MIRTYFNLLMNDPQKLFLADVKQEILKLMLKKGSLSSLISNSHQNFKKDLIQRLEQYGYNKTEELDSLKTNKADTSKLALILYLTSFSNWNSKPEFDTGKNVFVSRKSDLI